MPPPKGVLSDIAKPEDRVFEFTAIFYDLSQIPGLPTAEGFKPFPKIIYERNEYQELDAFIEAQRKQDVDSAAQDPPRPIVILGQPGIGEVIYRLTSCC